MCERLEMAEKPHSGPSNRGAGVPSLYVACACALHWAHCRHLYCALVFWCGYVYVE